MGTQSKLRREEVRRAKSERAAPFLKRFKERVGLATPAIAGGFFLVGLGVMFYGAEPLRYHIGQEVSQPILARVKFDVPDEQATEKSKQKAREDAPNYYTLNESVIASITGTIRTLYNAAQTESFEAYQQQRREQQTGDGAQAIKWELDEDAFSELHNFSGEEGQSRFSSLLQRLDQGLRKERLVRRGAENAREPSSLANNAIIIGAEAGPRDEVISDDTLKVDKISLDYFSDSNPDRVRDVARRLAGDPQTFPGALRPIVRDILIDTLSQQPLLKFDLEKTMDRMEADSGLMRVALKFSYPTDVLAAAAEDNDAGGWYRLTPTHIEQLEHEHAKFTELLTWPEDDLDPEEVVVARQLRHVVYRERIGRSAVLLLLILGVIAYCGMFQKRVLDNPVRALSLGILFLTMMFASRLLYIEGITVRYPMALVAPVVMTAAILTIVYNQRFAIGMTAALALLVVLTVRGDLPTLIVLCTSMAVVIYQFREIRNRSELFSTGLLNGVTAFIAGAVVSIMLGHTTAVAVEFGVVAAIAAVLAIAIFFLVLSPVERIFKVATNWTLLELLDTSRPLLTRLAQEAPGTYNHSLWLSALAEDACEVIGANGLLAKVGAMYHDIGKVHKAEYFAENQQSHINRHDKLAPTMSLLVIVGHVKDGVEMAKEYGLPPAVIRFIQEHHGTTVVRYFHHAASEQQKASGLGREISESEFRYPGPKPQSRETAVLMLCDGVEGAVRALPEPTAGRIENVVHTVLMDRLQDGQFDDCDITLKELHKIEESLVKSLCRFYHGRVPYPKAEKVEKPEPQTGTHA